MAYEEALAIGYVGFVALMYHISFRLDERHSVLRPLFFFLGYYGTMGLLHLLSEIVEEANPTATSIIAHLDQMYSVMTYVLFFIAAYFFIIYFIFDLVIKRIDIKKKRQDKWEL